ncbi:MAG: GMC family oxidoreductase [Proteobacteria bacterium]|nr:GMC family oxidoreductase [Pseudomonadota bacterium]
MGVSFFEHMRGELVDNAGRTHAADFDIKAEAKHIRQLLRTGRTRITGIVRARPWADDRVLEGTLTISPLRHREIAYEFRFSDEDDRRFRMTGRKDLDPRHPLRSMTRMAATLFGTDEAGGEESVLARGELRFHLDDLPSFATGWLLSSGVPGLDLQGSPRSELPTLAPLSTKEQRTLRAYGEALFEPGEHVPAMDDETLARTLALLPHLPPAVRGAFRASLAALDAAALAHKGQAFASLPLAARRRLISDPDAPLAAGLNFLVGFPLKSAHFSRRDYLDAIGVPTFDNPVREPEPAWMANVLAPEELEEEQTFEADVVVVGTGAGGGPMAALLAERGLAVAVIEEGRYHDRSAFSGAPEDRIRTLWRDGGMTVSVGNAPLVIPTGRMVGGTTAINSGTCFPTPDHILAEWRNLHGLPDDFRPDTFGAHLESVSRELQVEPADRRWVGGIADIVARGADELGVEHGPLSRNAPGCDGQGVCPAGCPTDAKRSTNVSYIPRALRAGATVFTGLPVTRLLRRGERVVAVEAQGQDENGAPRTLRVRARAVVVCAGTFQSPLLLRDNGIDLPQLGRNLSVHPAVGVQALSESIEAPWRAIPQGYGVHGLVDPRVRFEGIYVPPQLNAAAVPLVGPQLTRWMDAQAHLGQFGFMVRDGNVGTVRRGPGGRPLIRYDLTPDVVELMRQGVATLAEMLLRGGATEVLVGAGPIGTVTRVEEARSVATTPLRASDFRAMAFHPLATCRMGPDARRGVVDSDHRVFGTRNLYVVDGSTVPTSLGVNPQVTIMAMAERAAIRLAQRLGA